MKPIQVVGFGPQAFEWMPDGIETVLQAHTTGCRCHGKGSLGTLITEAGANLEASREIPCPCLHIVIPEPRRKSIETQVNDHFMEVELKGWLCPCMWCVQRRKLQAAAAP